MTLREDDVTYEAWPRRDRGGQQVGVRGGGIIAIHVPTGIAIVVDDQRSQHANRIFALARLTVLVADLVADEWLTMKWKEDSV